jgi:hypothetical protein
MMLTNVMPRNGLPSEEVLRDALDQSGYAVIHSLVDDQACAALASMYDGAADRFRSTVTMARHGFGRGEYKYLSRPLPDLVQNLRETLYPPLSVIANEWAERLRTPRCWPAHHRSVSSSRGWSKAIVRHGVAEIRSGARRTLGVIFHDAA